MMHNSTDVNTDKSTPKAWIKVSWVAILFLTLGIAFLQTLSEKVEKDEGFDDPAGLVVMQLQCQYLLGIAELTDEYQQVASQAAMLDVGTIDQRQRYVAFMMAMGDVDAAKTSSIELQKALQESNKSMSKDQVLIQEVLDYIQDGGKPPATDEVIFKKQMGWFSTLLLASDDERKSIAVTAAKKVLVVGLSATIIGLFGIFGFVLLIVFFVKALSDTLQTKMTPPLARHGIYAEVFVVWILLFLGFGIVFSGLLASSDFVVERPAIGILLTLVSFLGSLIALYWARIRGLTWQQIREDIGWHRGVGVFKEFTWGILGYGMTIPILLIGILFTLVLIVIQQLMSGGIGEEAFQGTGGGSHPIIIEIANGGWGLRAMLLMLAAVAAPIVEETMFRGVLYRQVRSSSWKLGKILSVVFSALLVSFVFAAIHPQGWVAIPALMGIAIGMTLLREYRGSLIASMAIHGVSNAIVTSILIIFIS